MAEIPISVAFDSEAACDVKHDHALTEPTLGIDFGTYQCSVAVWNGAEIVMLKGTQNKRLLRSHVMFDNEIPVGGINEKLGHDENEILSGRAVFNMKRLIGRIDTDPVIQSSKNVPFLVQTLGIGIRPFVAALVNNAWRFAKVDEVLAVFLVELRLMAEAHLKRAVRNVVFTIPGSFSRFQQTRIERACTRAGLHVLRFLAEPSAVALVYSQQHQQAVHDMRDSGSEKVALVFNMGAGGYCDVALTTTAGGVSQVKALSGAAIGGEDLLQNTMRHLMPEFDNILCGRYCLNEIQSLRLLRIAAQDEIHELSSQDSVQVNVDLMNGTEICRTLTRKEFEAVNENVFSRCGNLVTQCLNDAKMGKEYLDGVILVGGCSNIPRIQSLVLGLCKKEAPYKGMNVFEAAVHDLALEGAIASGISDPLGTLDLLTIQATPLRLGTRGNGDYFVPIIQRSTVVPVRKDMMFTTAHHNQTEVLIVVCEGEEKKVGGKRLLGFFKVGGIPPGPKGSFEINVCMDIDASNVLRVVAGVVDPTSPAPISLFSEVRMPTLDDGHGWSSEALDKMYGANLNIEIVQRKIKP